MNIITFGIQKGGASKTVSSCITSYILSHYDGAKVLLVDMDSQANATQTLTQKPSNDFDGSTVFELMKEVYENKTIDAEAAKEKYIVNIKENLDLLPASDSLSNFWRWIYTEVIPNGDDYTNQLKNTLELFKDEYTHIIIDSAPDLSERMVMTLASSTDVVVMFEPSVSCLTGVPKYIETVEFVKENLNPSLHIAGVAPTIIDVRRKETSIYINQLKELFEEKVFNHIIQRKAETSRISLYGFENNPEIKKAIQPYVEWVDELLNRLS